MRNNGRLVDNGLQCIGGYAEPPAPSTKLSCDPLLIRSRPADATKAARRRMRKLTRKISDFLFCSPHLPPCSEVSEAAKPILSRQDCGLNADAQSLAVATLSAMSTSPLHGSRNPGCAGHENWFYWVISATRRDGAIHGTALYIQSGLEQLDDRTSRLSRRS